MNETNLYKMSSSFFIEIFANNVRYATKKFKFKKKFHQL